jgi:hypothetical protein
MNANDTQIRTVPAFICVHFRLEFLTVVVPRRSLVGLGDYGFREFSNPAIMIRTSASIDAGMMRRRSENYAGHSRERHEFQLSGPADQPNRRRSDAY